MPKNVTPLLYCWAFSKLELPKIFKWDEYPNFYCCLRMN